MKKKIFALLMTAVMAAGLVACGNGGDEKKESDANQKTEEEGKKEEEGNDGEQDSTGEVITVTLWSMYAEDNDPTKMGSRVQKLMDDFNATHDDIKVEVSLGKTYDNIVTAISAEDTPDLFQMYWQYAAPLSTRGALYDLTDFVNNDADFDKADFLEKAWKLCTVDDRIYSIPFTASTSFAVYNVDVLKEAGYDSFPTTVEDMIQCAKDCYDVESTSMGMNPLTPWLDNVMWPAMTRASWEDADGKPVFDTEAMRLAYSLQKDLIDYQGGYEKCSGWQADFGNALGGVTDPVLTGEVGFLLLPDSSLPARYNAGVEANSIYDQNWSIAQVPGNSMFTAAVYEMNAKTKNAEAAWEVMSYLNSKESMAYLAEGENGVGQLMPRTSALEALNGMDTVCDAMKKAADLIKNADLQSFPMSGYVNEYLDAIGNNMTQYLEGTLDLDAAMKSVQDEVDVAAQ